MWQKLSQLLLILEQKRKERGAQNVDVTQVMGDVNDNSLNEELETWKHFLKNSEIENGRHRVYNFAEEVPDPKYMLEKLDVVFDGLKGAANLNVAFGFVLKNKKIGVVGFIMQTKTLHYLRHLNLWLLQKTGKISRIYRESPMSMNRVQENEPTEDGYFTSRRMLNFLQPYSKKFPWAVKTLYCHIHYWKIIQSNAKYLKRIPEIWTMTFSASLELWRCICKEMRNPRRNFQIIHSIPQKNWWNWSCKLPRSFYGRSCSSGGYCSSRFCCTILTL